MAYNRTLQHFVSSQELATIWASGVDYVLNQLVIDNDKLYICTADHTSGATFAGDAAYWDGVQPGDTLAIADGGTGQTTQTAAFDALAPTTTAGDIIVHNGTDNVRQGIGADGQVLVVDSAQTNKLKWATIQQGSKNYIPNSTFENGVTPPSSWSTFSVAIDATTKIPSGAITSPDATYTLATSGSSALAGSYSMTAATGGTVTITTTGHGFISDAFTIDREDQAKPMQFSFYYEAVLGTMNFSGTSSNTFAVYVYDATNSTWIQPAGVYNMTQGSGVGLASGTFQTSATGTQYRLAVIMINSVSGALTIKLDDFQLGPQKVVYGAPMSDWTAYTPVFTGMGTGSYTSATGRWRRIGDSIQIQVEAAKDASGGTGSSKIQVSIPFGTIDTTKFDTSTTGASTCGSFIQAATAYTGVVLVESSTTLSFYTGTVSGALVGSMWTANAQISAIATIPITGLSSNTVMSNDTDTRVVAASYWRSATAAVSINAQIDFDSQAFDTSASTTTGASWKYTAPVSGYYKITSYMNSSTALASVINIYKNGSLFAPLGYTANFSTNTFSGSNIIKLNAGDYFDLRPTAAVTITGNASQSSANASFIEVERLSGPATIASSESVIARYKCTTADTTSSSDPINYDLKDIDTHNAVTTGAAWKFTAPISGRYLVNVSQGAATATSNTIYIYINGSGSRILAQGSANIAYSGSDVVSLNAGDYIDIRNGSGTVLTLTNDSTINHIAIERLDR